MAGGLVEHFQRITINTAPSGTYFGGNLIHLWFFALGGILWYTLFYRSKYIPRLLSIWGIVGASLVLIASALACFEVRVLALVLPNTLFELAIGLWLVVKGIKSYEVES